MLFKTKSSNRKKILKYTKLKTKILHNIAKVNINGWELTVEIYNVIFVILSQTSN